jgi:hypothetical protein
VARALGGEALATRSYDRPVVTPIVVLALALMVMALGSTFVAGLALQRVTRGLSRHARADVDRIRSLADELQQNAMVTTAEVETLTESVERLIASRKRRSRRSR